MSVGTGTALTVDYVETWVTLACTDTIEVGVLSTGGPTLIVVWIPLSGMTDVTLPIDDVVALHALTFRAIEQRIGSAGRASSADVVAALLA